MAKIISYINLNVNFISNNQLFNNIKYTPLNKSLGTLEYISLDDSSIIMIVYDNGVWTSGDEYRIIRIDPPELMVSNKFKLFLKDKAIRLDTSGPSVPDIPEQQLLAPTIAISGDTLQITDNSSGLATSFDILVDGVVKGSVEVEQEETITDLTGTTWTIPAGWTATAGYGAYEIFGFIYYSKEYYISITSPNQNNKTFCLGYDYSYPNYFIPTANNLWHSYNNSDGSGYNIKPMTNSNSFTLTITGGTDATNPTLIAWLQANGTLANTTYTIPAGGYEFYETPNFPTTDIFQNDISFYVTYSGSYRKQTSLAIGSDGRISVGSGGTLDAELYSNGEWQLDFNLSITFDSNQTVSKEFYDWFYNNAFLRSGGAN